MAKKAAKKTAKKSASKSGGGVAPPVTKAAALIQGAYDSGTPVPPIRTGTSDRGPIQ